MTGNLKVTLGAETVRALESRPGPANQAAGTVLAGLLRRLAEAAVAAAGSAAPGAPEAGRPGLLTGLEEPVPTESGPSDLAADSALGFPAMAVGGAVQAEQPARDGLVRRAGPQPSPVGSTGAAGPGPRVDGRAGGRTVVANVTNYYAVPRQRVAEAPSEWAEWMSWT